MTEYGFLPTLIIPYIADSVLIQEDTGCRKTVICHVLRDVYLDKAQNF